jgi:superfamily I DNA/RNA helicase/RecB family exonuclease
MRTAPPALDAVQRRVVDHGDGPLLVTGGPGTGKSALLRERFVRLIDAGADPEGVLLIVRTRRDRRAARDELLTRLDRSLPGLRVVTAHGLALDVVNGRFDSLGYRAAPQLLTASEQYERVRELLAGEDPAEWPAYGGMLGLRGFADQVRQFLRRAQEARRSPDDLQAVASRAGLTGWIELAGFYRRYLDVLYARGEVDFAGLVVQAGNAAAAGDPLYEHVMVDDYQEATDAIARLLIELRPSSLVVAGDAGSHVFSFQGTTDRPLREFGADFPAGTAVSLSVPYRFGGGESQSPPVEAWEGLHDSEEHAAIARELRRVHVEDAVSWRELAVVVRRAGPEAAALVRALDDAGVPRVVPETRLALQTQPATFPYLLALRWLASPDQRDSLIESVLTSELAGLSPAAARGLLRAATTDGRPRSRALEMKDGLSPDEAESIGTLRDVLDRAEAFAGRSVLDAFSLLWRELPCSRRLVDATATLRGRSDMEAIRSLADAVERVSQQDDPSVVRFLDLMQRGEEGPGFGPAGAEDVDAVRVLTAHGAAGREFDTVVVAEVLEGNFPSLSRPEPMFDLDVLDRVVTQAERNRERLEDERRLFNVARTRARRRVLFTAGRPGAADPGIGARSRFEAEIGAEWTPFPQTSTVEPVSVGEAAAAWRRDLARTDERPGIRLAALEGLTALGIDPARWWFQRDWTETGAPLHAEVRVSYSRLEKLENCALQYVLGEELGLENRAGYHAWVGSLVHTLIEECEEGAIERTEEALVETANARWRPQEFPSMAVSEAFRRAVTERMLPAWMKEFGETPSLDREIRFEFEVDGAMVTGYVDRVGPLQTGGTIITDYKTGKKANTAPPDENLQLGIYYLALNAVPELREFLPVKAVELAFLKERSKGQISRAQLPLTPTAAGEYATAMRDRLGGLIGRVRELLATEVYRPNPAAECFHCRFKPLCPLYPEGRPVLPVEAAS